MKMISIMPKVMMGIFTCAGAGLFADDIAVGKWARLTIDDNTPALGAGEGLYLCEKAASVSYAGTDTWTLPLGSVFAFGSTEIAVRNGTLLISSSTAPDLVVNPPAELQKAAVWLDATKNVDVKEIANNGTSHNCAINWYDARETSLENPSYGYAEAYNTASYRSPILSSYNGKVCIDQRFGNTQKERCLMYKSADGSLVSHNIRHAFFVRSSARTDSLENAPVLGNSSEYYFSSDSDSANLRILAANGEANPLAYSCEYLIDGVHDDPTSNIDNEMHLHEFTLPSNRTVPVDSIGRDGDRLAGGHRIYEIVLFTDPLTVLERMRITAYLKSKWFGSGASAIAVKTVADGKVELGEGVSINDIDVSGNGTLVVGSGSKVRHLYSDHGKTYPAYALENSGSNMELQAAEYEYALSPRDNVAVSDLTRVSQLEKNTGAAIGSATVSSVRPFLVSKLDSSITNLSLTGGGDVVLRASSDAEEYIPGTSAKASISATTLKVPQGTAGVATTVVVPENGDYELEFDIKNRVVDASKAGGPSAAYRFELSNERGAVWHVCPTVVDSSMYGSVLQHRRYLIRNLVAGEYVLTASGKYNSSVAADVANLSITLVVNRSAESVVPVVDGDFEQSTFERLFFATYVNNRYSDWTFTNGSLEKNPAYQTIVSSVMGSGNYDYMFRSSQLGRYGDNSLLLYHNGGDVKSPVTVFPVSGNYSLRIDAVRWMTGTNVHGSAECQCNTQPVLEAFVKINDGDPISLGSISPSKFVADTYSFPIGVDIAQNDSVVVILQQTADYGAVQIDNLEFVKSAFASSEYGAELIVNGSGENGNEGWNFDNYLADGYNHKAEIKNPIAIDYGTTYCDGVNAIRSANGGRAWQTLALQAGVYKLSFWSRPREWSDGNISYLTRLSFWYTQEGSSVTNTFYESDLLWCTEFIERSALFSVPEDGTFVFGFNSENEKGKDSLVDCVSVKQVLKMDSVPDISEHTRIEVSGGGKLRLDFTGCLNLAKVKINGSVLSGEISAAKYPQLVCGTGTVYVKPKGFVLICR